MPWEPTTMTETRGKFILADQQRVLKGTITMAGLCEEFRIARKTGYKLLDRDSREGWQGVEERSRAPRSGPHWIEPACREAILQVKEECRDFGAKKIRADLESTYPTLAWPSVSTIHTILKRAGWVEKQGGRKRYPHPGRPPSPRVISPNEEWSTDFKGQFRTRDRRYCYPLTVIDTFSRFLIGCDSLLEP